MTEIRTMTEAAGEWSVETVAGKTVDTYVPSGGASYESAVIYLHDDDLVTLPQDETLSGLLDELRLICVCPHGSQSWWLDEISPAFDEETSPLTFVREQVVAWIESRWNVDPPSIGLFGTGMGGQGALQLAYRHARTFPVVAAVAPIVDFHVLYGRGGPLDELFDSTEAARQQTATLHIHPLNWPPEQLIICDPADMSRYEGCERLFSKLSSMGIPFDSDLTFSSAGDGQEILPQAVRRCLSFLSDGLKRIRKRQ